MNELIKISFESENPTVSGRELHEALGVKEKYTEWFKRMCEFGFTENEDYLLVSEKTETNNPKNPFTVITNHALTIPMAKELCMLQRNDKGKEFRQYFIAVENQWNTPEAVMSRALKMANAKLEEIKHTNFYLCQKIEADKPKVLFADAVATAKTSILIGELAKILKQNGIDTGEKRLFEWLRGNGYLIKRKGTDYNAPTQQSMDMNLFEVKETAISHSDGHTTVNKTTKVTGKGQAYFINKFLGGVNN